MRFVAHIQESRYCCRQGDVVLFREGPVKPGGRYFVIPPKGVVIATGRRGEHRLVGPGRYRRRKDVVVLPAGARLVHRSNRHDPIELAPGVWEVRRQRAEHVDGWQAAVGRVVEETDDGVLYESAVRGDRILVVRSPSSGRSHALRVPFACWTVRAARQWTMGLREVDAPPDVET